MCLYCLFSLQHLILLKVKDSISDYNCGVFRWQSTSQGGSASAAKMKAIKHLSEAQETPVFTHFDASDLTMSRGCKRKVTHHSVFQVQKKNEKQIYDFFFRVWGFVVCCV